MTFLGEIFLLLRLLMWFISSFPLPLGISFPGRRRSWWRQFFGGLLTDRRGNRWQNDGIAPNPQEKELPAKAQQHVPNWHFTAVFCLAGNSVSPWGGGALSFWLHLPPSRGQQDFQGIKPAASLLPEGRRARSRRRPGSRSPV